MKYSQWIGIAASLVLIIACFFPFAYYPDLGKDFTGFFSENNSYGRPGRVFVVFATVATIFFLLPKVWAKRWNLLVCALTAAFAIKTFITFSGCYRGICPEKKTALYIMLAAALVMLVMAIIPDIKIKEGKKTT